MKVVTQISKILVYVSLALVVFLMLLTCADVFMRAVFNRPITGTAEMARYVMVSLVLGMAWCSVKGHHISVDLVMSRFSPRVNAIVDSLTLTAGLVITGIITWRAFVESQWERNFNYTISNTSTIPTFPFWWLYTLGWAMMGVAIIFLIIQRVGEAVKK